MKLSTFSLLILLSLSFSCGKKIKHTSQEKSLASIEAELNEGNFEKAIDTLEKLRKENPQDEEVNIKLLHAYAGAGGFEALKAIDIWKEVQSNIREEKDELSEAAHYSLNEFINELDLVLQPIPDLTEKQKVRLDQAIDLYQELGYRVETATKYTNFKWGTLHVYRLAVKMKEIIKETKLVQAQDTQQINLKALEQAIIPNLKIMGKDLFMAYKLFGNSFKKITRIIKKLDKFIAKTVKNRKFKLKVNTLATSEAEFYSSLLKDNIQAFSTLFKKLVDIYKDGKYPEQIESAFRDNLPQEADFKRTQLEIETLIRVFLENFFKENNQIEPRLKSIFNDSLKQEFNKAIEESLKVKNTDPLKELLQSKQPEMELINTYYKVLVQEIDVSDLEEEIKTALEVLKEKVNLEILKLELEAINDALKEDTKVIKFGAEHIVYDNREKILERQEKVKKEIDWIVNYLNNLIDGVQQSTQGEDPDKDKQQKIIDETKNFVESK